MDILGKNIEVVAALRHAIQLEVRNCITANVTRKDEALAADNAWWQLLTLIDKGPFIR